MLKFKTVAYLCGMDESRYNCNVFGTETENVFVTETENVFVTENENGIGTENANVFVKETENVFVTDMLMADEELERSIRQNYDKWIVRVSLPFHPEKLPLFYRNLIRLKFKHGVDPQLVRIEIEGDGTTGKMIAGRLVSMGYADTHLVPKGPTTAVAAEDAETYGGCCSPGVLLTEFTVAGVQYKLSENHPLWTSIHEGMSLSLVAEPDNPYDSKAIVVGAIDGDGKNICVGYVPRLNNHAIWALMTAGHGDILEATVTECNPDVPFDIRLKAAVYIKNNQINPL